MLSQIIIAITLGITLGIITGLIPGIHVNLVALILLSISPYLPFTTIQLSILIICCAITHSFLDSIPSIYLGAPDADQALSVLPGHRMLHKGQGHKAILYTLLGSLSCLILGVSLFPLFIKLMSFYDLIRDYIAYILIAIMIYLIRDVSSLMMFLLSGLTGLVVLNLPLSNPLFHMLSGLFGLSILLLSTESTIPEQEHDTEMRFDPAPTAAATGVGFFAAFLPGFGSSQAAIIASSFVDVGDEGFLTLTGGINTANMLISILSVYALDKARNGAIVAVRTFGEVDLDMMLIFLAAAMITAGIATILGIKLSKVFCRFITKVNYKYLIYSIISSIALLSFIFDGFLGLAVLTHSAAVGILSAKKGVAKNNLMGCLIIPVIIFFII
mgnify:CR=1 FL=1